MANTTFLSDAVFQEMSTALKEVESIINDEEYLLLSQVFAVIGMTVTCIGLVTNILNIVGFVSIGIDDGVTTLFLSIALSDLTFVALVFVRSIALIFYTLEQDNLWWFFIDPFAVLVFSSNASTMVYTMTVLASTFLAVARCMCIAKPLHFKDMFNKNRCIGVLVVFAVFSVVCYTPIFVEMGMTTVIDPKQNATRYVLYLSPNRERVKDIVILIIDCIIPLVTQVIVVVCVVIMASKLREATKFRHSQGKDDTERSATKLSGKELQVVKQVVLISVIYIISNIPKIFISNFSIFDSRFDFGKPFFNLYLTINHLKLAFESFNSAVNFFVYFFYNTKFRSICLSLIGRNKGA